MTTAPATHTTETPYRLRPRQWRALTGMSLSETLNQLRKGDLRGVQVGKAWYIEAREVTDFFERNGRPAAA